MRRLLATLGGTAVVLAACGSGSPSSPSSQPEFEGQFTGSYVINTCTEIGVFFSGFCAATNSAAGGTFAIEASFVQGQSTVSGTIVLSRGNGTPIRGPFQGAVQPSGHLSGSVALEPLMLLGTINRDITSWDSTVSGNRLDGSFTFVHRSATEAGTMTISATLIQMSRR